MASRFYEGRAKGLIYKEPGRRLICSDRSFQLRSS